MKSFSYSVLFAENCVVHDKKKLLLACKANTFKISLEVYFYLFSLYWCCSVHIKTKNIRFFNRFLVFLFSVTFTVSLWAHVMSHKMILVIYFCRYYFPSISCSILILSFSNNRFPFKNIFFSSFFLLIST